MKASSGTPVFKKWWFWVIAVLLFFYILGSSNKDKTAVSDNSYKPTVTSTQTPTPTATPTATPEPTKVPEKVEFSTLEVTKENIDLAVKGIIGEDNYKGCDITVENNMTIVDVFFNPGFVWDETDLVNQTARNAVNAMEILFTNPGIDKIWFWAETAMIDAKGNESDVNVVNVALTKENAADINWPKFKEMVVTDYQKLFNIADDSFINPNIAKNLK